LADAWKALFEKGDGVGIKVYSRWWTEPLLGRFGMLHSNPEGEKRLECDPRYPRVTAYSPEFIQEGIGQRAPGRCGGGGVGKSDNVQLEMGGYDPDQYMEMASSSGEETRNDGPYRRSYVARIRHQASEQDPQFDGVETPIGGRDARA